MSDLAALSAVSARIGADPLLVQGPGGNASLKLGDELWVKASGVWLAQAMERPIFAGLALGAVRAAVAAGAEDFTAARLPAADPALRPSIETALHALLPQSVVLHTHAANSMATSILADGRARAAAALTGLRWGWVPYRRPGAPLAAAIAAVLAATPCDVLLLANHGIIVAAETPDAAEALLRDVEARLALPVRTLPAGSAAAFANADYGDAPALAGLAIDAVALALLTAAPRFPDQIVFVGGAVPALATGESVTAAVARVQAATGIAPALLLVPGQGTLVRRNSSAAARAVIDGLYAVACRVPVGAVVVGLPDSAAGELLGWDAEAYRQGLAK